MIDFKHLFFDLDNTLLDFTYASRHAFDDVLLHFNKQDKQAYGVYSEGNKKVWADFEEGKISAKELRGKRFQLLLDRMDWKGDGFVWNKYYLERVIEHTQFLDGAEDLLSSLNKKYSLHLLTNGLKEVQRPRLEKAKITQIFDSITVSDEIGHAKPQAAFFDVAMRNANLLHKAEILMIGDSYNSDIKGGHNYGLKTCWLNPRKTKMDPEVHDFEIHDISSLLDLLD